MVFSSKRLFVPVAAACPTSVIALAAEEAELEHYEGQKVETWTIFPQDLEGAVAWCGDDSPHLKILFFKWIHDEKAEKREIWKPAFRLVHRKFRTSSELTMQLYPLLQVVEFRDGNRRYVAVWQRNQTVHTAVEQHFQGAEIVWLRSFLEFAISERAHYEE